jgi:hypothetical protein
LKQVCICVLSAAWESRSDFCRATFSDGLRVWREKFVAASESLLFCCYPATEPSEAAPIVNFALFALKTG